MSPALVDGIVDSPLATLARSVNRRRTYGLGLVVILGCLLVSSLSTQEPDGDTDGELTLTEHEKRHLRNADLVVLGRIRAFGKKAERWSGGGGVSSQAVVYDIEEVLHGRCSLPEVAIHHILVQGSETARADRPGLSQELFRVNRRVIVGAKLDDARGSDCYLSYAFVSQDESVGPLKADDKALRTVRRFLRQE